MRSPRTALGAALLLTAAALVAPPAQAAPAAAPGGPGTASRFDLARKDCLGTSRTGASKVWYTVADGVLSDVYEPTIDNTDVQTLQYVVTDGSTFTDLQSRDTAYTVSADSTGMACTVTSTSAAHHYTLTTTYLTDPARDTVLMHTRLTARGAGLRLYARVDAHVNGNGGGGTRNGGADSGTVTGGIPVIGDTATVSQAANRDYAAPTFMALTATSRHAASVGYAGTASDGLSQLAATHALTSYTSAPDGHVTATEDVTPAAHDLTLALGFGRSASQAASTAAASLRTPFGAVQADYRRGWTSYDAGLARPSLDRAGYDLSANVLKASEDKSHPGAVVASLASPWGQAVDASALVNGEPVYFGSYREVFSRDLYEAFTGFLVDGDLATARAATRFLLTEQQLPTGELPRNSLLNGRAAPDTGGDQLDETAYPILMAYQSGLAGDAALWPHIRSAADFLVARGPSYGVERWEEQSGYSPSTIAAEIAGLTAASAIASRHGDAGRALLYQATADDFQRHVKDWTVTTTEGTPHFIRLSRSGDPDAATTYNLGNGGPTLDQRTVLDGGFQDLVRLGELPATDPAVQATLPLLDGKLSVTTPTGQGYYRYGDDAADGSADGYGDCYQPSQSSCGAQGEPWPTTGTGTGHLWPVLSGERAETDLATGNIKAATSLLGFLTRSASGVGLVPEQVWEDQDLAASPYGTDPATASIGFTDGHAAGSASPLTWGQAQELRLILDLSAHRVLERPSITTDRYVAHTPPAAAPLTLTSPAAGATVEGGTVTVTGTTVPNAKVTVQVAPTDLGTAAATVRTTAGADGAFSVTAPVGFGTDVVTAAAAAPGGATGHAQVSVVGDVSGGTTVLDHTDPAGDDNGPGTYQYPTAADFQPGSYDLTGFQVITSGGTVYLRTRLANLVPTFGNTMGAQLEDVYVHVPGAATSTAAAFPSRNYTVGDGWSQRIEVQGFAAPVWQDAAGGQVGTPTAVVASTTAGTITIALPEAQFGTPGSGWTFTVVLAGQDGYSADQARAFAATPQAYAFGVCAPGGTAAICAADPATVPKAMDVLTPAGAAQSTELDPALGPVVLAGVAVP